MRRVSFIGIALAACLCLVVDEVAAQRGGRDRGRDRGERGDRRGFGGPPGGFGGRSSFGGPPSGGFGGSSGDRGRSWGGRDRGGRPDFDPSQVGTRIAGYFDRNRDGYLDGGELQRMPSSFKERFSAGGIDTSRGISVNDFGKRAGDAIRQRMEQRQREFESGGRDRDRRTYEREGTSSKGSAFKQRERVKFLPTLPEEYKEGDSDGDGQIALFEWAAWKRSDMFAFFELDANQDGFLTPKELDGDKTEEERGIVSKRGRLTVSGSGSSRLRGVGSTKSKSSKSPEEKKRQEARNSYYFSALDRDRDGTISMEEWERSRRVRGTFEKAGMKVKAMSKDEFMKSYAKAVEKTGGSSGSSERRSSWGGDRGSSRDGGGDRSRGRDWGGDRGSMRRGR